jgi:hypothetical protein
MTIRGASAGAYYALSYSMTIEATVRIKEHILAQRLSIRGKDRNGFDLILVKMN